MTAGFHGTFVVSCEQVEIDGLKGCGASALKLGSLWRWDGRAIRVDGPADILLLGGKRQGFDDGQQSTRRFAPVLGSTSGDLTRAFPDLDHDDFDVTLTDGHQEFPLQILERPQVSGPGRLLYVFLQGLPSPKRDLWIARYRLPDMPDGIDPGFARAMLCFTSRTLIETPQGSKPVETLVPGDMVHTRDNGPQPVIWTGRSEITRRFAASHAEVCPVRLNTNALCNGEPDRPLILSPGHRILLSGRAAQALFNTDEVLVAAKDLIDGNNIRPALPANGDGYHHILFEEHQIVRAESVYCESFHPADADLGLLSQGQQDTLDHVAPEYFRDPECYGDHARRCLSSAEAAILGHAMDPRTALVH